MRRKPIENRKIRSESNRDTSARTNGTWKRLGLAVLVTATVGFTGCQTFRFPANPFAGAKLPGAKFAIPRLPSMAKLPKPNFGNIARNITTPSRQAITSSAPQIASANRQPPPPPSRKFDSTSTDEKLAKASGGKFDFGDANGAANAELTPAQKRFKDALTKHQNKKTDFVAKTNPGNSLWGDYKPDPAASVSKNLSTKRIEQLSKVNRGLYDQYGKLTTGGGSSKLGQPIDPKMFAAKASNADIEKTNQSVAELKLQLENLKARGSGNSDEFTMPARTAIEIAGSAPQTPAKVDAEARLHKGFGSSSQLKPVNGYANQGTVNIPDPTAPANVLRASLGQTPGLVQATNVGGPGKYSATSFGGYAAENLSPSDLPTGSLLPQSTEDLVANEFVKKVDQQDIPSLTATATPKPFEMPLQREVSDASLAALAENARLAAATPKPKITFQNPIQQTVVAMSRPNSPVALASPATAPATAVANPAPVSAFNIPATGSLQVTKNQFFGTPKESAVTLNMPVAPTKRVAQAPQRSNPLSIMNRPEPSATALPAGLVTGDSTYAPGSIVKPQAESRWR